MMGFGHVDRDVVAAAQAGNTYTYGGLDTVHQTGEVNVEVGPDGNVAAVWFRCMRLPFTQSKVGPTRAALVAEGREELRKIVSIEKEAALWRLRMTCEEADPLMVCPGCGLGCWECECPFECECQGGSEECRE